MSEPPWFLAAQACFRAFVREMAEHGVETDPDLELVRGEGLLCHYDHEANRISLSIPESDHPVGRLQLALCRAVLGCETTQGLMEILEILVPWLVAHELAHHYRYRAGLFGDDLWREEQIANVLASALTKYRHPPETLRRAVFLLREAGGKAAREMKLRHLPEDTYFDPVAALNRTGDLNAEEADRLFTLNRCLDLPVEQMLKGSQGISPEVAERLAQRDGILQAFNESYTAHVLRYLCYQLTWQSLSLESPERCYVAEFIRDHLGRPVQDLEAPSLPERLDPVAIRAAFAAHVWTREASPEASRYFYKRYRSLLVGQLKQALCLQGTEGSGRELEGVLLAWDVDEADVLDYMAHVLPESLRDLLPGRMTSTAPMPLAAVEGCLPEETDRRLFRHATGSLEDGAVARTLSLLAFLDGTELFRGLPAEILLRMIQRMLPLRLAVGETLIWQGQGNTDVYVLQRGSLDVLAGPPGSERRLATLGPGDVLGEIGFFSRRKRTATVRAATASECLVLKDTDLRLLGFAHPMLFLVMARMLARRMERAADL